MKRKNRENRTLTEKYPPSPPCSCSVCVGYCRRPGWWTVEEASRAIDGGYACRMMLEVSPQMTLGVLSPAFRGCEGGYALGIYAPYGCNFLKNNLCELHGTGFQPLECRFCHHERLGLGQRCHLDIERDWNTKSGQALVAKWVNLVDLKNIWNKGRRILL